MRDMRALIRGLADGGMTVVLSSHILIEVEELCNRVGIIRKGQIVFEGTISELRASSAGSWQLRTTDDELALRVCRSAAGVEDAAATASGISFRAPEPAVADLSVALVEAGAALTALTPHAATLEDLFFRLTEGDGDAAAEPIEPVGEPV
jgi:ABC-2 type transport system ATP-binding protein